MGWKVAAYFFLQKLPEVKSDPFSHIFFAVPKDEMFTGLTNNHSKIPDGQYYCFKF